MSRFFGMLGLMIDPDEREPYSIQPEDVRFKIVDWEGKMILITRDSPSAEQYAALLNQAFRRGFKAGFRKGRTP